MRCEDIDSLLEEVKEYIELIEGKYKEAKEDNSIKYVFKPKVKSSLEHLRSCLDYCAQDIYDKYCVAGNKKIYMPYGRIENDFKSAVGSYFGDLKKTNSNIYNLLESIQPYRNRNSYIVTLCELCNYNKHNNLSDQQRVNKGESSIYCQCIVVNKDCDPKEIDEEDYLGLAVENINWTEFRFVDKDIDVLELIKGSLSQIKKFKEDLYKILT